MTYLPEFLTLALAHFLAVASPGPDFAVVAKQSLLAGRRPALWTSIGVGLGIGVHVVYCVLGLGLIISKSIVVFSILKFVGAAYLIYIGIKSIRATGTLAPLHNAEQTNEAQSTGDIRKSIALGFYTNALNPKATLFFLALFTVIINPSTPFAVQCLYGLWMILATMAWFSTLSYLLSGQVARSVISRAGTWFERVMGVFLVALGLKLATAKLD